MLSNEVANYIDRCIEKDIKDSYIDLILHKIKENKTLITVKENALLEQTERYLKMHCSLEQVISYYDYGLIIGYERLGSILMTNVDTLLWKGRTL